MREIQTANIRERVTRDRSKKGEWIDLAGSYLSNPWCFIIVFGSHLLWIVVNIGWIPGIQPFDPYPFTFLATITSAEAPLFTLIILMRQHRDTRIQELNQETQLQVSLHIEKKLSLLLHSVAFPRGRGNDSKTFDADNEKEALEPLDLDPMIQSIREQLEKVDPGSGGSDI